MVRLPVALIAAASAVALTQFASAADMPTKAPVYKAPPPVTAHYNWSGFYAGGNGGYSIGRDPSALSFGPPSIIYTPSFTLAPAGWLAGGQFGYNWQAGNWVFGLEADWQWSGPKDSACLSLCVQGAIFQGTLLEQKLKWFGTARGRIGYAVDYWLWYVTGGAAWGRVETNLPVVAASGIGSANFNDPKGGWVLGGGVETALSGNWSAKLEYLYMDLGRTTDIININIAGAILPLVVPVTSDIRDHIIRVGLNYRFAGAPVAAAVGPIYKAASPPASYNWTGLYAGVNSGYSIGHNQNTAALFVPALLANESFTLAPAGWLAGGQFGYNWQTGNWVFGLEADWQWSGQKDSACIEFCASPPGGNYEFVTDEQKLKWFGTARGRIGYAVDYWLWYVTGGAAWGRVETNVTLGNNISTTTAVANFNDTKGGWVLGGGVETALSGNWSAKLEYLYMDLGTTTTSFTSSIPGCPGCVVATTSDIRDHAVRIGLNYRFAPTVVAAKD